MSFMCGVHHVRTVSRPDANDHLSRVAGVDDLGADPLEMGLQLLDVAVVVALALLPAVRGTPLSVNACPLNSSA
jgi:hypothetical protein